jgi:excisionase family DNA binding protein
MTRLDKAQAGDRLKGWLQFSYMANKNLTDKGFQKAQRIHNPVRKRLYTLKEAAEYLGRSDWGMRDLIWKQLIPVVMNSGGRKIFIDVQDLEAYVNNNKSIYH